MYTGTHDYPQTLTSRPMRKITVSTLLCFGLAGLILGFTFGAFIARAPGGQTSRLTQSNSTNPIIAQRSSPGVATPTPENLFLDPPSIAPGNFSEQETADGTTSYTLTAQAIDKTTKNPVQTADVVCKLWLTDSAQETDKALSANKYALLVAVDQLAQPFPHELEGALNFNGSTKQVQTCVANGKNTWSYTLSPALPPGTYFLAILADWKGIHYNWSYRQITVPGSDA